MARVYNFSAGPAMLPEEVLLQAQAELLDWQGSGMSVMEVSHRGKRFSAFAEQAERDLRELLSIPHDYHVLFMQGGATAQFSLVPLNLLRGATRADYFDTGQWSAKAIAAARRYCTANVAVDAAPLGLHSVPPRSEWQLDPRAAYVHYTPNETIGGLEFHEVPDTGDVPLVADMSSTILSRPLDVARFGLIYAGAQKNAGPAGITLVIVRKDLAGEAHAHTPEVFDYARVAASGSMLNTPPTLAWYLAGLVIAWLLRQGGLAAMGARNARKAQLLYDAIDASAFYSNPIDPAYRSWMNVPFTLADPELDARFLQESATAGLTELKGHRSVGGMRASLYNAMPEEGVRALVAFMSEFERRNG